MGQPQLVDPPFSFFDLAEEYGGLSIKPLKRCFSILRRLGVRTMIRTESELLPAQFESDEDEPECFVVAAATPVQRIRRHTLTFFDQPYSDLEQVPKDGRTLLGQISLKGFETLKKTFWKVERSVLAPESVPDYYICAYAEHSVMVPPPVSGRVAAATHCQQSWFTNCCAHAAIRTALESLPKFNGTIPTRREMNHQIGINHNSRKAWDGMTTEEVSDILTSTGARPLAFTFEKGRKRPFSFDHLIYLGIESGFPVIVGFTTDKAKGGHVVTVVGHTFNGNSWLPEARSDYSLEFSKDKIGYIPSSAWLDNFILQDDEFGPYYCLPSTFLEKAELELVLTIVTDLDSNHCFADKAELAAIKIVPTLEALNQKQGSGSEPGEAIAKWSRILFQHAKIDKMIARTTLASSASYRTELRERRVAPTDFDPESLYKKLEGLLPHRFWLTELSVPELFNVNRAKVADIIVDPATARVSFVRLPNYIVLPMKQQRTFAMVRTRDMGHVPLRNIARCTTRSQRVTPA